MRLKESGVLAVLLGLFGLGAGAISAAQADELPPAPVGMVDLDEQLLQLELVLNHALTGKLVPVLQRAGHYWLHAADVTDLGLPLTDAVLDAQGRLAIDALPEVKVVYDSANLRLLIDVPPAWLPKQVLGRDALRARPAQSGNGLVLNYDIYSTHAARGPEMTSAWNELRWFNQAGVVSTTGVLRKVAGESARYSRYDTRWSFADEKRMLTWEAGDLVTRGPAWSSAVRLGGLQLSRDFSLRPDIVTYPMPHLAGQSAVPGAVDLFVNGYRASQSPVAAGPFVLNDVPMINGSGEAVIVVTDALGRQVSTTVPFYVSSALLKPGLSDYAVSVGALRRNYGLHDFDYGRLAAQGSWRYGVHDGLTLEGHAEAAAGLGLAGAGSVLRLGQAGVLNLAWSSSRHAKGSGSQQTLGYQYSKRNFNVSAQHRRNSRNFVDLGAIDGSDCCANQRSSSSVAASLAMGRYGSLGMGWFDIRSRSVRFSRTQLLNLTWGLPLWRKHYLTLAGNRELGRRRWSGALQWIIPLGAERGTVYASFERNQTGYSDPPAGARPGPEEPRNDVNRAQHGRDQRDTVRLQYSRTVPSAGGWGWNLARTQSADSPAYQQADVSWRNNHVQLQGGMYGRAGALTSWANASGALVGMDGSWFGSNQVRDAFVVVDTGGQADIPVRYQNQLMGRTGSDGRLLVPWASAYQEAKYEIDPMELPPSIETPLVEQQVAVSRGAGYLLKFPVRRVVAASVRLHDPQGQPLPLATEVTLDDGRQAVVGWDGLVYLEGLQARNRLHARGADGQSCSAEFALDVERDEVAQIGPLRCR